MFLKLLYPPCSTKLSTHDYDLDSIFTTFLNKVKLRIYILSVSEHKLCVDILFFACVNASCVTDVISNRKPFFSPRINARIIYLLCR